VQIWRQGRVRAVERVACGLEADALVLDHLTRLGCDTTQPRECRHYLYLPYELGALATARWLHASGWDAEVEEVEGAWLVTGTTITKLSDDTVRDTRVWLEELASDHGGAYDGWEAAAD
jgi:regulator of ribonuclease activity B